jgi:CelD/BcsL family acetyltransferase involved in cellulose biosynthesis
MAISKSQLPLAGNNFSLRLLRPTCGSDDYEIITDAAAMLALRREWQELCARSTGYYLGQTFEWARISWETVAQPRGRRLLCLVARRDGRVGLIWPLVTYRDRGRSVARPLNSGTSEYSAVLVEDCADAEQRVAVAWRVLRACCGCDRIELENVRSDSVLGRVLSRWAASAGRVFSHATSPQDAPWVSWAGIGAWDTYLRRLDGEQRRVLGRRRRRLAEAGDLCFEPVTEPARCEALLDWILDHKRTWLERARLHNGWLFSREYRAFLSASMATFAPSGRRIIFALKLDGRTTAAQLSSIDDTRVECFIGAYDLEYGKYGPGHLLHEHCLRWAFDHSLDYDFRIGGESEKFIWSNRTGGAVNYICVNSARGAIDLLASRVAGRTRFLAARRAVPIRQVIKKAGRWGIGPPPEE